MATPTLLQHKATGEHTTNTADESTGGNGFKVSLPNPTLSGNCLILGLRYAYTAARRVAITDDKGNPWGSTPDVTVNNGTIATSIFVLPNVLLGTVILTIMFDANVTGFQATVSEYNNIATVSPVNGTTSNSASSAPTVTATATTWTPGANTGGNLLWNYAVDTSNGASNNDDTFTAIAAGANFALQSAQRLIGVATQTYVQVTPAALTPTLTFTGGTDTFNSVAVALKVASAGTAAGPGIRILHEASYYIDTSNPSPATIQFPSTGTLLAGMLDVVGTQAAWSATSSSPSQTWSQVTLAGGTGVPQAFYAAAATGDPTLTITLTFGATSSVLEWHWYDIVNALAVPFDVEADAGGNITGSGNSAAAPSITPTTPYGLILCAMAAGTGPDSAVTTGDQAIYDGVPYTGEKDDGQLNNGDAWQHVFNRTTAAVPFIYHFTQTTGWNATAVAFKGVQPPFQANAVWLLT